MTRRAGLTLVEVLVSIFVMAIGMIALLTLFPIGILQMAQAIRQDRVLRSATAAQSVLSMSLGLDAQGNAVSVCWDTTMLTNVTALPLLPGYDQSYFSNAGAGGAAINQWANPNGPSFAVMVDPQGSAAAAAVANAQKWVGGVPPVLGNAGATTYGLRRRPTSFTGTTAAMKMWFSQLDDIIFENEMPTVPPSFLPGTPKQPAPNTMMRDALYSWTYVLQRPRTNDPSTVNCTIVLFENRPVVLSQVGATDGAATNAGARSLPEYVFSGASFYTGVGAPLIAGQAPNTIAVVSAVAPPVRVGDWLYDATIISRNLAKNQFFPEIASAFYRVVAVDQIATNTYQYEVQQPIRPMVQDPGFPLARTLPGTVIVMEGIVEVFERGPMRLP